MTATLVPVASALGFTLGCAAIHHLHRHAEGMTRLLSALILVLIAALYVTWILHGAPAQVDDAVMLDASGVYEAGMPLPDR